MSGTIHDQAEAIISFLEEESERLENKTDRYVENNGEDNRAKQLRMHKASIDDAIEVFRDEYGIY